MIPLYIICLVSSTSSYSPQVTSSRWRHSRMTSRRLYSSNNNFYDDFEDFGNLGSNDDSSSNLSSSLQSRVSQVKDAEAAYDAKIARNWRRGNWGVRGFALDKSSETEDPVLVSAVAAPTSSSFTDISLPQDRALPEDRRVAVGRSDGSVFIVKLGEQYLTKFMSVPKLVVEQEGNEGQEEGEDAGMTVRVESEWMDSNDLQNKLQDEPPMLESPMGEEGAVEMMADKQNPFEIVKQFVASEQGEPINVLVFHDVDNGDEGIICTAAGTSGDVYMWTFPPSDKTMQHEMQGTLLSGVHTGEIVSLKTMVLQNNDKEQNVLVSASRDGKFSLWDLDRNGELIFTCHCAEVERDSSVSLTCADVSNPSSLEHDYNYSDNDKDVIFLGTSDGYVVGYVVQELLALGRNSMSESPAPNLRFRAHGTDSGKAEAVTAIKCGGDGTIPTSARLRGGADEAGDRNPRMTSSVLLTGGEDGSVKQWEILSQKSGASVRMEHWPRLSTQRMKRRSHLFSPGHDGAVSSISQQGADSSKFLTCGQDGSVCVWSAASGKELFRMDGFSSSISSLACLGRELLVTDGMEEYVCVHDFGIEEDAASKGYDLEW